LKPIKKGEH